MRQSIATIEQQNKMTSVMLDLQNDVNRIVNPEWREAGYRWYRAAWTEAAEGLDYTQWEWWKTKKTDNSQLKLELTDVWHFGLSDLLVKHDSVNNAMHVIGLELLAFQNNSIDLESLDFTEEVEEFVLQSLVTKSFPIQQFFILLSMQGMGYDELYSLYIGKNMLNRFRQENGYGEGTYTKHWDLNGSKVEDNVVMYNICQELDATDDKFPLSIHQQLTAKYPG